MNTNLRPSPLAATLTLCAALLGFGALPAQAAPGDLDPTFGTGGRAVIATGGGTTTGNAVAVQADGKVVVAGNPGLARFTAAGVADGTFGVGGFLATNSRHFSVVAFGGKLITSSLGSDGVQRITRYLDNGSVDTSFGSSGSFTRNAANSAGMMLIALHADGRIVYVTTDEFGPGTRAVYAGRLTADGNVDTTFNGGNLREILGFGANQPGTIRLQSDGQVLVAGTSSSSFFVAYLNPDGTMASGFGTGGVAMTEQGAIESEVGLQLSPAGIFLSGTSWAGGSDYDFTVVRLAWANGAVQQVARAGFGQGDVASALFMYDDGQLIVAGTADDLGQQRFAMIRFNANFTLDASFGTDGKVLDTGSHGRARAIVRQADGKFVIAGEDNADNFMAQRYDGRLTSTIALSATPFATNPGQEAGLVATLPGVQGGTVDFRDGGITIPGCEARPVVFGAALCNTSSLPSGTRTITGFYSGDGYFLPSSSAPFAYSVRYLFNIVIEGGQEVPSAATTALGTGTITIDTVTNQLSYDLSFSGLSSSETAAHIHGFSSRGVISGILHTLPAGSPKVGTFFYSEGQEASLTSGQAYVNIHSTNFPGGEIRGQIDNQGGVPKNLSVTRAGAGAAFGIVSGTGIFCPSDCFEQYAHGTNVTLTATSTQGAPFLGWSGACSGTGTCNVTMSFARSVTATFGAAPPLLSRMHFRLGEDDPGASSGAFGNAATQASAETPGWQLFKQYNPVYNQGAGSIGSLGMQFPPPADAFTIHKYQRADSAFGGLSDNFGVEAWVRTEGALTMDATIASVAAPNGFSLVRSGGNYVARLGGLGSTQGGPVVVSRWTHIAMTHIAGTTRFYMNGVETGAPLVSASPTISIFNHETQIAGRGPVLGGDFVGTIDDVRFFTLQPGTFQPSMLNVRPYTAFKSGTGTGDVTANAGALTCDAFSCNGVVPTGTVVTLLANPAAGTTFGGWDGCDSVPTQYQCVITVQQGMSVSAAFNALPTIRSPRDANGDGRSDIFWRDPSNQAALWLIDGVTVSEGLLLLGPSSWQIQAIADFNGDGRADIVWKDTSGMAAMWLLDGSNIVNSSLILGPGTGWSVTHTGDFNNDGRSDLVWKHTDGSVSLWLMDGLSVIGSTIIFGPGSPWSVTHVADLNGDGSSDLVWRNASDGSVSAWLMQGLQASDTGFVFGGGTTWQVAHTGDFDANGTHDLLFRDAGGQLSIFFMNGLAVTNSGIIYGGGAFDVTHVADFNGDGTTDLLFKDAGGQVAVWLIDGLSVTGSTILFGGGGGWAVTHTGDYNGDGKSDLLWKDAGGQVAIWLLDGTAILGSALIFGGNGGWVAAP